MAALVSKTKPQHAGWRGWVVGILLTILAGKFLLLPLGDSLARLSYDLPFVCQKGIPSELVMVYLDSNAKQNLRQPLDQPLDRHFYTELVNRLTDDGSRLVLFDFVFDVPHTNSAVDEAFAAAMRRNGRVILVADYAKELNGNVFTEGPQPSISVLNSAAAGWGLANVSPDKGDWGIRKLDTGVTDYPSVSWVASKALGAPVTRQERLQPRWLNYYCWPGDFKAVNIDHVLLNGLPGGSFRDKIVVVGSRPALGLAGAAREEFPNPWTRLGRGDSTGPSVHALSLLNLLRGDFLTRIGSVAENAGVILWGTVITVLLMNLRPWLAMAAAAACAAVFAIVSGCLQLSQHFWFAWAIPAVAQTSVALIWSVGYQYLIETRRRKQLRRAFGAYLSPFMADQIANSQFDLALGGKEVEASVMFTDLEGFTTMSESLPPSEVSKILTTYFNQTTRVILDQDGTIIKYIGDAVMAVWGAPLPEKYHARRAVLAAWGMSQAAKQEVAGRRLRTRIGVNTGIVLSGNLGSDYRFDYTCIGDTTNFAARLEGLNKHLGTDILISEFTVQQLDGSIELRSLGRFIVSGKKNAIGIFEVLGEARNFSQEVPWQREFAAALEQFQSGGLETAAKGFQQAIDLRDGKDGPSEFYLKHIAKVIARSEIREGWDGNVRLDEK